MFSPSRNTGEVLIKPDKEYCVDDYVEIGEEPIYNDLNIEPNKNGLIKVKEKVSLTNSHIEYVQDRDKYLLYYHPFLRENYSGILTGIRFKLNDISGSKYHDLEIWVAPHPRKLKVEKEGAPGIKPDYWQGPKFSKELLNETNSEPLTIHKRTKEELNKMWPIQRTEFHVKDIQKNKKEIQIEEINPTFPEYHSYSEKYVLQKYAHLIWDKKSENFEHFDVSIRVYMKDEHMKRSQYKWKPKDINQEADFDEKKLLRIDGGISLNTAKCCLGYFFRYNELIGEYFGNDPSIRPQAIGGFTLSI